MPISTFLFSWVLVEILYNGHGVVTHYYKSEVQFTSLYHYEILKINKFIAFYWLHPGEIISL